VNLFLPKLNLEIFKNVILPKIRYIYLDKFYTRSYCWTKGEKMVYIEAEPTHHLADSTDQQKETIITIDLLKLWRSMRTCWKDDQVSFRMQPTSHHLDLAPRSYDHISANCSERQQSSRDRILVAQKPRRRVRIEDHFGNASLIGLPPSNVETSVHSYLRDLFLV